MRLELENGIAETDPSAERVRQLLATLSPGSVRRLPFRSTGSRISQVEQDRHLVLKPTTVIATVHDAGKAIRRKVLPGLTAPLAIIIAGIEDPVGSKC